MTQLLRRMHRNLKRITVLIETKSMERRLLIKKESLDVDQKQNSDSFFFNSAKTQKQPIVQLVMMAWSITRIITAILGILTSVPFY